tara:strand:+ start:3868 stop:4047 length:180 start_codon:yes stop_codon:yes gene_type:complete
MKAYFNCPENDGTQLIVDGEDDTKLISIMTPWKDKFRQEWIVCLEGEELARFKKAVAEL